MFSKIYWLPIPGGQERSLGIMARPRGNDWLIDEIQGLQRSKVNIVVCLLENSELYELGLKQEATYCVEQGLSFIHYPIQDVKVPTNEKTFLNLTNDLQKRLDKKQKIVIHCRMGIGRSSILAAALLIKNGIHKSSVFDYISNFREVTVPDTDQQKDWLLNLF